MDIVIGIGGTGAKLVEALIHMAAAGLTGDSLTVGFIDQDSANGNVTRSIELAKAYREARAGWTQSGHDHRLDVAQGPEMSPFATRIDLLTEDRFVPHPERGSRLHSLLEVREGDEKALFDLLFHEGPREQTMILDGGYVARPHIGAMAITHAVDEVDHPFWKSLSHLVAQAKAGSEVRLLLAGSIFGGTGAAGFPTIARLVRDLIGNHANLKIGGLLMLPYFGFAAPGDAQSNAARSEDLLLQARDALLHYEHLLKAEPPLFNELYLLGWEPTLQLGYHQASAREQRNPALVPEVLAAMGACRFLCGRYVHSEASPPVYISARGDRVPTWADVAKLLGADARPGVGRWIRFAVAWKHHRDELSKAKSGFSLFGGRAPFKAQKLAADPPESLLKLIDHYVDMQIQWLHEVEVGGGGRDLWTVEAMIEDRARAITEPPFVRADLQADADFIRAFRDAAGPNSAQPQSLSHNLSDKRATGAHSGHGTAVAALHQFSGSEKV